jgi:hypothetical protein
MTGSLQPPRSLLLCRSTLVAVILFPSKMYYNHPFNFSGSPIHSFGFSGSPMYYSFSCIHECPLVYYDDSHFQFLIFFIRLFCFFKYMILWISLFKLLQFLIWSLPLLPQKEYWNILSELFVSICFLFKCRYNVLWYENCCYDLMIYIFMCTICPIYPHPHIIFYLSIHHFVFNFSKLTLDKH